MTDLEDRSAQPAAYGRPGAEPASAPASLHERLDAGVVVPAHPLALDDSSRLDPAAQRALTLYQLDAGAHGLLSVTPYYSRPTQDGIIAHTRALADATDLPVMLYDIPGRSATALDTQTILTLAEHPRILAVKDAKGSLAASQEVLASGTIAYYSGEDALNLPLLSSGAVGIVSVVGHVAADRFSTLVSLVASNDVAAARRIAADLVPLVDAIMNRMPGVVAAKAALELLGVIPSRTTRLPLLPADAQQVDAVRLALRRSEYLTC